MDEQVDDTRISSDELVEIYYPLASARYMGMISGLTLSFPDNHVIHPTPPDMHLQGIFDAVHMSPCPAFIRLVSLVSLQAITC